LGSVRRLLKTSSAIPKPGILDFLTLLAGYGSVAETLVC
jgi:hypothetical protein